MSTPGVSTTAEVDIYHGEDMKTSISIIQIYTKFASQFPGQSQGFLSPLNEDIYIQSCDIMKWIVRYLFTIKYLWYDVLMNLIQSLNNNMRQVFSLPSGLDAQAKGIVQGTCH